MASQSSCELVEVKASRLVIRPDTPSNSERASRHSKFRFRKCRDSRRTPGRNEIHPAPLQFLRLAALLSEQMANMLISFAMARRPDRERAEILSKKDLKELRYNLVHLSVTAVRHFY